MSGGVCTFCSAAARYVCPRCGVPYCSLPCYRSARHERCSEGFYRQCVEESLRSERHGPEVARRVQEALAREARLRDEAEPADSDDSESDPEDDLAERLQGVDLDDAESVWSRLTPAERDEFRRQAAAGTIATEPWRPWWELRAERPKVAELDGPEVVPEFVAAAPAHLEDVPPLSSLSRQPPSPLVINSVINLLYSHAFLLLLHGGEWGGAELEAVDELARLCGSLSRGEAPETSRAAVEAAEARAGGAEFPADPALRRAARRAVQDLLTGPNPTESAWFVLAAISDAWRLLDAALARLRDARRRVKTSDGPRDREWDGVDAGNTGEEERSFSTTFGAAAPETTLTRPELRRMKKKLEFLFAWSREHEAELRERASRPTAETKVVIPTSSSATATAD